MDVNKVKSYIKKTIPSEYLNKLRALYYRTITLLSNEHKREAMRLYWKDYSYLELNHHTNQSIEKTYEVAKQIHGEEWNYYSDALRREVSYTFQAAIQTLSQDFKSINYLEIGSAKGLSMSVIGSILKSQGVLGELFSIDPYHENGYKEGEGAILHEELLVNINKSTRIEALQLYENLQLDVRQLELKSNEGLVKLLGLNKKFHLIYIDGYHEKLVPVIDFGLSCELLYPKGVIMLDDHTWEDIKGLKKLCDKYLVKIFESWKVVAYQIP
jgi:hypothetical protein